MAKLPVHGLPSGDDGRILIRLNLSYRDSIKRFGIAKITNNRNKKRTFALILGHDDKNKIFMPYDIRTALGVEAGGELDFSIEPVGICGKVRWYVSSPDPAIHLPAWLALGGITFSIIGVIIAVVPVVWGGC